MHQGDLKKLTCLRCGHTWTPRIIVPQRCPYCISRLWDVPKEKQGK